MTGPPQSKPCRVLMLIENNVYPWDRRMFNEAEALLQAGYEVGVICPQGEMPEERVFFEVSGGVRVYRFPTYWRFGGKLGYLFEYSWAFFWTAILSVLVWLRDGFDILHSANPPDMFFLLAWPYKLLGKKYVFDEHDLCPELYDSKFHGRGWARKLLLSLQKGSYRAADLVISTNQSYREIALERGQVTDERSVIVRNGVDIEKFHRGTARPELKEGFSYMAVYVGVMGVQDGVDRVVRAAEHVVHTLKRRDVIFIMVGKGDTWNDLCKLSRELKVDDVVKFVGRIPDELMLDYLSTADVCMAPDPPDPMNQLSTMTKIMEYMACENPIVSFDLLETRRSAGDAAVYVHGDDPRELGQAMLDLLADPERRRKMAQIGLDRSINLVDLGRSRRALQAAYDRLSGRSATALSQESVSPPELREKPVKESSPSR